MKTFVFAQLKRNIGDIKMPKGIESFFSKTTEKRRRTFALIMHEVLASDWGSLGLPLLEEWLLWLIAATLLQSRLTRKELVSLALTVFNPISGQCSPCKFGVPGSLKMVRAFLKDKPMRPVEGLGIKALSSQFTAMAEDRDSIRNWNNGRKSESGISAQMSALASLGHLIDALETSTRIETVEVITYSLCSTASCRAYLIMGNATVSRSAMYSAYTPIIHAIEAAINSDREPAK